MKQLIILTFFSVLSITAILAQEPTAERVHLVEETNVYVFNELDYALYQAYNSFLEGHNAQTGARLNRAAYFVKQEANQAAVHNKKPILKQAERLESLADSIALGRIQRPWKLRRAFAKTHHVLAKDYKLRAAAFWAGDQVEATGHALTSAAGYLGHAAKWTGTKIESGFVNSGKAIGKAGKATGKAVASAGKATGKAVVDAGRPQVMP